MKLRRVSAISSLVLMGSLSFVLDCHIDQLDWWAVIVTVGLAFGLDLWGVHTEWSKKLELSQKQDRIKLSEVYIELMDIKISWQRSTGNEQYLVRGKSGRNTEEDIIYLRDQISGLRMEVKQLKSKGVKL